MEISLQSYKLLELIAICGELPYDGLHLLPFGPAYLKKLLTFLHKEKYITNYCSDGLRGYRLTLKSKKILLDHNPQRFSFYLTGNAETNVFRSDIRRRHRIQQIAQVQLIMHAAGIEIFRDQKPALFDLDSLPLAEDEIDYPVFYDSRELKAMGMAHTKIGNSRAVGILLTPDTIYIVYNTGESILKWMRNSEKRMAAQMEYHFCLGPYFRCFAQHKLKGLMLGKDMDCIIPLLNSEGGYRDKWFRIDDTYTNFSFIPVSKQGIFLLSLLCRPDIQKHLNGLLQTDFCSLDQESTIDCDAVTAAGIPVLFCYDCDLYRISRFCKGTAFSKGSCGAVVCFDFQEAALKKYDRNLKVEYQLSLEGVKQAYGL